MKSTAILSYAKMLVENRPFGTAFDQQHQQQTNREKKGQKNERKHKIQHPLAHPVGPGMTKRPPWNRTTQANLHPCGVSFARQLLRERAVKVANRLAHQPG